MNASSRYSAVTAGLVILVSLGIMGCPTGGNVALPLGNNVCLQCHNGVQAPGQNSFLQSAHKNIACELCHGSGQLHVREGGRDGLFIGNPAKEPFDKMYAVCNQCHQGQLNQYLLSDHAVAKAVTCFDCHDVHKPGGMTRDPKNNSLCQQCHETLGFATDEDVTAHTHHPVDPAGTGASRCTECHLPPLRRLDQEDGPHDHSLMGIAPETSADAIAAGQTPMPNSCAGTMGCHDGSVITAPVFDVDSEDDNRLAQTIFETWFPSGGAK